MKSMVPDKAPRLGRCIGRLHLQPNQETAMATAKNQSGGKIPDGFVSPFKRVQQQERMDDAFACIATITGRTLEEVTKFAVQLGYPAHGPAYVSNSLITKVLYNLGFNGGEYEEMASIDALPDVAILAVDYQGDDTELSRHVVWHHVRGTDSYPSFSYVIDPAHWLPEKHHVTSSFGHLKLDPAWYIEVVPKTNGKGKAK
jgi:hypothetical protein